MNVMGKRNLSEAQLRFVNDKMPGSRFAPKDVDPEHQVVPHFGFKPEAIRPNSGPATVKLDAPDPVMRLARPPEWATVDGIPCQPEAGASRAEFIAHVEQWEATPRHTNAERAWGLCEGCPVKGECLAAALEEESGISAQYRFLVRGGLLPRDRAALAARMAAQGETA